MDQNDLTALVAGQIAVLLITQLTGNARSYNDQEVAARSVELARKIVDAAKK